MSWVNPSSPSRRRAEGEPRGSQARPHVLKAPLYWPLHCSQVSPSPCLRLPWMAWWREGTVSGSRALASQLSPAGCDM